MIVPAILLAAVQAASPGGEATIAPRPPTMPAIAQPGAPRVMGMPAQRMLPLQQRAGSTPMPAGTAAPAPEASVPARTPSQTTATRSGVAGPPSREQVLAAVRAEWPNYDTRHQGRLGPLEFGTWVMRANGASVQAPGARRTAEGMKPVTAMNATSRAFAKADANHDGGVTPEELAAFLTAR